MYLVDTSVWIHALRPAGNQTVRSLLRPLIISREAAVTEWILLELMTGLRKSETRDELLNWFRPIERLDFPSYYGWDVIGESAAKLRKRGLAVTAADCFIATAALSYKVPLVHCDADFEAMKPTLPLRTVDWTSHVRGR